MKQLSIDIRAFSAFMGAVLLTSIPARAMAQTGPLEAGSSVTPGEAGTTGAAPLDPTTHGPEPLGETYGVVPSVQATTPAFGSGPIGVVAFSPPSNLSILPNGSPQLPRPLVPLATGTNQ